MELDPKEKAIELRNKMFLKIPARYNPSCEPDFPIAKNLAIIAVEEILDVVRFKLTNKFNYWFKVRQELDKL